MVFRVYRANRCHLLGIVQTREVEATNASAGDSTMHISDEHFRGRTVIAADGQAVGEVAALFIETSTWTVISLQIKLSKTAAEQLGASRSLLHAATIELPVGLVQSVGDTVLLSVPTLGLRQTSPEAADQEKP
jgi:sporulation protein YlmC with PRC-barrel domain